MAVLLLMLTAIIADKPQKLYLVVTRQREARTLYHLINDIDPHAFVTQSQVMGVFGEGFDKFKIKNKNNKKHLETISLEEK